MKATKIAMALAVLVGLSALLLQQDGGADHILITNAVATPGADGRIAVTMDFENRGAPDRVIDVFSTEAIAMLHAPDSASAPPLPAGIGYSFATNSAHIMLSNLDGDATPGRLIPLTLTFAAAGEVTLKAQIKAAEMGAMQHGATGHGAMHMVPETATGPSLRIVAQAEDSGWRIFVLTEKFAFSQEAADGPHQEGVGHGHLYVGGMKVGRVYSDQAMIGALPPGEHVLRVSLNTNDHRIYVVGGEPVTATTTIVVD